MNFCRYFFIPPKINCGVLKKPLICAPPVDLADFFCPAWSQDFLLCAAYASAGLSYDTKFDLRNVLELPYNSNYFSVPPHAPHGQNPKLGSLHPSMVRIAGAALATARK